jgi:O-antigen/teichoic acid export membrane protein
MTAAEAPLSLLGFGAAASRVRRRLKSQQTFAHFVLSVGVLNAVSLLGNALAFRWVDPTSMGAWQTLVLLNSYLAILRFGVVNGLGRELPFALGRGDQPLAARIAATSYLYNAVCGILGGLVFLGLWIAFWNSGPGFRVAVPAMAVVSATSFYLTYLQATFRSDAEFAALTKVQWVQAGIAVSLPVFVCLWGFTGLCVQTALQSLVATAYAHVLRPFRVRPRFEPRLARELVTTGLPLFAAGYLQTAALGFDRVILLHRAGVAALGYYAPAVAVLTAMAIVPGAVSNYIYPRMSYALGAGRTSGDLRRMALLAALVSVLAGLPVAVLGFFVAPPAIVRFFPRYVASIPALKWALVSGLLAGSTPAATVLGSLKAWRSLSFYVGVNLASRWAFPWILSRTGDPLGGVAKGSALAALVAAILSVVLVKTTRMQVEEAAA